MILHLPDMISTSARVSFFFKENYKLIFIHRKMLTCALRSQDKNLKKELKIKYCVEKIIFKFLRL